MAECSMKAEVQDTPDINSSLDEVQQCCQCKNTLNQPMRLQCLHSYCKTCLENIPKCEQDGQLGWLCGKCDIFTKEDQVKDDWLLEKVISLENEKGSTKEVPVCEFCQKNKKEMLFCRECMICLCTECKVMHDKIPSIKHHHVDALQEGTINKKTLIDEVYYCNKHETHVLEMYCDTCGVIMCRTCVDSHKKHEIETTDSKLNEFSSNMDDYTKNITASLKVADTKVKEIEKEIMNIKETYAKWRIESDLKMEMLFNQLKAKKAMMDETVNDEESRNIETLKELKNNIQKQAERLRVVNNLATVTKLKTRHQSQLMELQSGLLEQARELSKYVNDTETFQVRVPYFDEQMYEYNDVELKTILRPVTYTEQTKIIDEHGYVNHGYVNHGLEYMCADLKLYLKQKFQKFETIEISNRWCNRVNMIGKSIYIGIDQMNMIKQFNTLGECVKSYNNTHKTYLVKQANNNDIITAGDEGIFISDIDFTQWKLLHDGLFTDMAIHNNKFTALEYKKKQVITYEYSSDNQEWKLKGLFDIEQQHRDGGYIGCNSTLIVDSHNHVIVCNHNELIVYSSNGEHLKTVSLTHNRYSITGLDVKGTVIICDYHTGIFYSINNISDFDPNSIEEYELCVNNQYTRDMTIDCDGNLWVLHGEAFNSYYLTKYRPIKYV